MPVPAGFVCVIVLDVCHWKADKRSILMERSAKGSFFFLGHTSILWIWTSGLQANRFLTLLLTGDGPRRKVGRIHTEMGVGVGINKEILPQWISVKDWQTDKKSTLSEGKWFTVGSGTRDIANTPPDWLCDLSSSHRMYLHLGCETAFFRDLDKSSEHVPVCLNCDHALYSFSP